MMENVLNLNENAGKEFRITCMKCGSTAILTDKGSKGKIKLGIDSDADESMDEINLILKCEKCKNEIEISSNYMDL